MGGFEKETAEAVSCGSYGHCPLIRESKNGIDLAKKCINTSKAHYQHITMSQLLHWLISGDQALVVRIKTMSQQSC